MARSKTEAAASKTKTAVALGALGGRIGAAGGPVGVSIGAGLGAITGLIIGDDTTVFPIDMVAIPAFQAHMVQGNPSFQIYIKAGETLVPTGGNVLDMSENMDIEAAAEPVKPKKKLSKWNRYVKNKKNQIRFKSGKNKGELDLKKMAKVGGFGKKGGRK